MSLLGKLAVLVVGDTSGLTSSLKDAKGQLNEFNKSAQKSGASFMSVGKVIAATGTAIVGTFTAITVKTAEYAKGIDEMSKRTGIGIKTLQELDYVAKLSNVDADAFGKAMGRLAVNANGAVQGNKKATQAFKDVGVSATDSQNRLKSLPELFLEISDSFSKMPDGTKKTADAIALFGKSGATLIPILDEGRAGIERLMKEADDLGIVLDEHSIKSLSDFDTNMKSIKASMGGMAMQIAGVVAPAFDKLSKSVIDFMKWFNGLPRGARDALVAVMALTGVIMALGGAFMVLVPQIYATITAATALNVSFTPFLVGGAIALGIAAIATALWNVHQNAVLAKTAVDQLTDAQLEQQETDIINQMKRMESQRKQEAARQKDLNDRSREAAHRRAAAGDPEQGLGNMMGDTNPEKKVPNKTTGKSPDDVEYQGLQERLAAVMAQRAKLAKEASTTQQPTVTPPPVKDQYDFNKELDKTNDKLKAIDTEAQVFGDSFDAVNEKASSLKSFITDALEHKISKDNPKLKEKIDLYNQLSDSMLKVDDLIDTTNAEVEDNGQSGVDDYYKTVTENQKKADQAIAEGTAKLQEALEGATPEWQKFANQLREFAAAEGVAEDTKKQLNDLASSIEDANWGTQANVGGGWINPAFQPQETTYNNKQANWWQDWLGQQTTFDQQATQNALDTADTIQGALGDGLFDVVTGKWKNLGDVVKNVLNDILQNMIKMFATREMQYFMSNGLGNAIGSMYGTGNYGGYTGGQIGGFSEGTSYIPHYANGGSVVAGHLYQVNDNGDPFELFRSNTDGEVIPLSKAGGLAPNVSINNINQTGVKSNMEVKDVKFDGEGFVITTIQKAAADRRGGMNRILGG